MAAKLGMDPLELRKKNDPNPVRLAQYDIGAKAIGWERRNKVPGEGQGPKKRGIGVAGGKWNVIAPEGPFSAECRIHRDGSVELLQGAQDIGTGFRTAMELLAAWAERLARAASGASTGSEIVAGEGAIHARLADSGGVERWIACWDKISLLARRTESLNLDRRLVLIDAFLSLANRQGRQTTGVLV